MSIRPEPSRWRFAGIAGRIEVAVDGTGRVRLDLIDGKASVELSRYSAGALAGILTRVALGGVVGGGWNYPGEVDYPDAMGSDFGKIGPMKETDMGSFESRRKAQSRRRRKSKRERKSNGKIMVSPSPAPDAPPASNFRMFRVVRPEIRS